MCQNNILEIKKNDAEKICKTLKSRENQYKKKIICSEIQRITTFFLNYQITIHFKEANDTL